ncbi:MAG: HEAT repeat domain-containing protein [Phototrophicaceae bacterium]
MQSQVDAAIIILTAQYVDSSACIGELRNLANLDIPLIGIILDDFDFRAIVNVASFTEIFDRRKFHSDQQFFDTFYSLLAELNLMTDTLLTSERIQYGNTLIAQLELDLQAKSIVRFINYSQETTDVIRNQPRGYPLQLLTKANFELLIDQEILIIEDLLSFKSIQPYILIHGESSQELSILVQMLCLLSAHAYRNSEDQTLPIYLDTATINVNGSVKDWICDTWSLEYDCNGWLDQKPICLFVDLENLNEIDSATILDKVSEFCLASENRSFVACTSSLSTTMIDKSYMVIVKSPTLTQGQLPNLTSTFLPNIDLLPLIDFRSTVFNDITWSYDEVSILIEYASFNQEKFQANQIPKHIVGHVLYRRWTTILADIDLPLSFDEFFNAIQFLAWHMIFNDYPNTIDQTEVVNLLGDSAFVELGVELGILRVGQDCIRFMSHVVQSHLSAYLLLTDGIYKHITKPAFNAQGRRIPSKWDDSLLATFNIVESEQYDEIVEIIDDIDPFIALEFTSQNNQLFSKYMFELIQKIFDIQRKNNNVLQSVISTISAIPQHYEVAKCIILLIRQSSISDQQQLHLILREIPYAVPEHVIQNIHDLDRNFEDARVELLQQERYDDWTIYLASLIEHTNPRIQRNAIFFAGGHGDLALLPCLISLIKHESLSVVKVTIQAIYNIQANSHSLQHIISNLQERHLHIDLLSTIFDKWELTFATFLLRMLTIESSNILNEFCQALSHLDNFQIIQITQQNLNDLSTMNLHTPLNNADVDPISKFRNLLHRQLEQIEDKLHIEAILVEIDEKMKKISHATDDFTETPSVHKRTKLLLNKTTVDNEPSDTEPDIIPDEILQLLDDDDWLKRYGAVQQLAKYNNSQVIGLLGDIALNDEDAQVQVGALEALSTIKSDQDITHIFMKCLVDSEPSVIDEATDYFKKQLVIDTHYIILLLNNSDVNTVNAAIEILSVHKDETAIDTLRQLQEDDRKAWLDEWTIGERAKQLLLELEGHTTTVLLPDEHNAREEANILKHAPPSDEDTSSKGKYSYEQKIQITLIALKKDDWELSQKAARYLRKLAEKMAHTKNTNVINMLENSLTDTNWTVRWAVVEALAWIKSPTSVDKIVKRLQDENWMVQVAATRTLVELQAYEKAPDIATLLHQSNTAVAETAAEALGTLKNPIVFNDLTSALSSKDEFVRLASISAMHHISAEQARNHLMQLLTDSYHHIRWFAIKELSENPPTEAIKLFANLLLDQSGIAWEQHSISDYALIALNNLNTPESRRFVQQWQANSDESR